MGRLKHLAPRLGRAPERIARLADPEHGRGARPDWHGWYKTQGWQRLRWKVLVRDLFTCALCGVVAGGKGEAIADHRQPHRGDPALFWDEDNLQCLCKACHDSTKQRADRAR